jgi:hypothetical protein
VKIYRCENEDGEGPWRAEMSLTELLDPYESEKWRNHGNQLPTLDEEVPNYSYRDNDYSAGVMSEDLFNEWFGPFEAELTKYGFIKHVYEVPKKYVILGKKQCVFNKSKARKLAQ